MNDTNQKSDETIPGEVLVVSQTGGGDFMSIAKAVEQASPGATIRIGSGFYEEAIVVNKSLTLIGDANGLPIITNSNFALLTVRSARLTLENVALVAGLRMPSIDLRSANVDLNGSILWTLDTFLKHTNPSLNPARALVAQSFLGDCMRNWLSIASIVADLLRPFDYAPEEPPRSAANQWPAASEDHPSDVVLESGSRFCGLNSVIGMASFTGNAQSTVSFSQCRLNYTTVTSCGGSEVLLSGCEQFGDPWKPRVYIRHGGCGGTFPQIYPTPDPMKREMEAIVRRQMQAQRQPTPITVRGENLSGPF